MTRQEQQFTGEDPEIERAGRPTEPRPGLHQERRRALERPLEPVSDMGNVRSNPEPLAQAPDHRGHQAAIWTKRTSQATRNTTMRFSDTLWSGLRSGNRRGAQAGIGRNPHPGANRDAVSRTVRQPRPVSTIRGLDIASSRPSQSILGRIRLLAMRFINRISLYKNDCTRSIGPHSTRSQEGPFVRTTDVSQPIWNPPALSYGRTSDLRHGPRQIPPGWRAAPRIDSVRENTSDA